MKKLLNIISNTTLCVVLASNVLAQCEFPNIPNVPTGGGANPPNINYESRNGWYLPGSGTIRVLVIFAEIDYDLNPFNDPVPIGTPGWPAHQAPTWANNLFDWNTPGTGLMTRYFNEASSGNYIVLGDYLTNPAGGGIFSVPESQGLASITALTNVINSTMTSFSTAHGLNSPSFFDLWTKTGPGIPKITPSIDNPNSYDHVMFIWRNIYYNNGVGNANPFGFSTQILGSTTDTYSYFGTWENFPFDIARHEYSHLIYGGNNFHCGGGGTGPDNYFIPRISGWSNMSLYDGSLRSWNGWDRQRMDWIASGNVYSVSARNASNTSEVNGDLDATVAAQAGTYTLRDFVTTGDAIRIKLPFINTSTEYQEWIWIENHNGKNVNGNPFDKWQYEHLGCVQPVIPGLYMNLQVDKDIRSASNANDVYSGYADYLRPMTAEGFYDREFETTQVLDPCASGSLTYAFKLPLGKENPLSGDNDQQWVAIDKNLNGLINFNDNMEQYSENQSGTYLHHSYFQGSSRNAFTITGNKKVAIGTNPSSSTMMNLVSFNWPPNPSASNLRKIYLNGVSIEILNQSGGNIQVQIKFDDIDVANDVRWCADEIVLNPIPNATPYSLNLLASKIITLDQGTTATRMDNPVLYNGVNIFASPTLMRVINGAQIQMNSNSQIIVKNGSTLKLETGSGIMMHAGSQLIVKTGSKLILEPGSGINNTGGRIIIEDGATIEYTQALINLITPTSTLEIAGLLDLKTPAIGTNVFEFTGDGFILFNSPQTISSTGYTNFVSGSNCAVLLKNSNSIGTQKILEVQQNILLAPSALLYFYLDVGVVRIGGGKRIEVKDGGPTTVTVNYTTVTSTTSSNNGHKGIWPNGQNCFINEATFELGQYGVLIYKT